MLLPEPAPVPTLTAFVAGLKAGLASSLILVTVGNFIGIGALAHDLGFSLAWTVLSSGLIWAGPAQVIVMTALAGHAALIGIAVAVALSAVRLLPMVVSLVPVLRGPRTRMVDLILPAHIISVTLWVEGLRLLPALARENRVAYFNGIGTSFIVAAMLSAAVGFYLAAGLPMVLTAALLMLTPLAFLMSTAANARSLGDHLALLLGLAAGSILAAYGVGLDLLWTGFIGGTLAYLAQRLWGRR